MKLNTSFFPGQALASKSLTGFLICLVIFCAGFFMHGNTALFFNLSGIAIVVGGTFGAALISFRLSRLLTVYKVLSGSYRRPLKSESEIIEVMVDLSVKRKLKGLLSLEEDEEEASMLLLRRALGYLVDGYPAEQIRDLLSTEINFFKLRRDDSERVLRTLAEICPSFGVVGSVVGLIAMLGGVDDTAVILKTVPVALTSTLYGVVFANFFFLPFAVNIRERTNHELLLGKIIIEGIVSISSELHPRTLEYKLKSFLTPSSRQGRLVSLERIRKRFDLKNEKSVKEASNYGNLRKHSF
jgi:chemotaxis protein MotA